jgi:lipid-A-disaccharide synthase-like uncharacterized protein
MPSPSHPSWLEQPNSIFWGVQILKLLVVQFLQSHFTASLSVPGIFFSTLFSNSVSLCSFLNFRDEVWRPCKTAGRIMVLYNLILCF